MREGVGRGEREGRERGRGEREEREQWGSTVEFHFANSVALKQKKDGCTVL